MSHNYLWRNQQITTLSLRQALIMWYRGLKQLSRIELYRFAVNPSTTLIPSSLLLRLISSCSTNVPSFEFLHFSSRAPKCVLHHAGGGFTILMSDGSKKSMGFTLNSNRSCPLRKLKFLHLWATPMKKMVKKERTLRVWLSYSPNYSEHLVFDCWAPTSLGSLDFMPQMTEIQRASDLHKSNFSCRGAKELLMLRRTWRRMRRREKEAPKSKRLT